MFLGLLFPLFQLPASALQRGDDVPLAINLGSRIPSIGKLNIDEGDVPLISATRRGACPRRMEESNWSVRASLRIQRALRRAGS